MSDKVKRNHLIITYVPPQLSKIRFEQLLSSIGPLIECNLVFCNCYDKQHNEEPSSTRIPCCAVYGFAKYRSECHAARAIKLLNGLRIENKILKVSYARPNTISIRNANLFITGLPRNYTETDLIEMLSNFGDIISLKLLKNKTYFPTGNKQDFLPFVGKAYVRYSTCYEAARALAHLNGIRLGPEKPITVKFTTLPERRYLLIVDYLPNYWSDLDLYNLFETFGSILYCFILYYGRDYSMRKGYVNINEYRGAVNALNALNGYQCGHNYLRVRFD